MTTCYGYTRVSTVKQGEGVSLEAQREAISRYADSNGLTITKWFEERETAAKSGRPIFSQIVKDLRAGRAQGLVVHKIDRSARNFRDWAVVGDLADSGVQIHFATESLDFDSRGGRLTADIQAVIAADYIRNLRDETRKGLYGRLNQGLYPYKAPLGYLDQGRGNAKIPDPARAPLIREMFEIYGTGKYSLRTLAQEMERRGLKSWSGRPVSRSSIEKLLANPFYTGIIKIKRTGDTYPAIHEPIIPVSLFERVQDIKANRFGKKVTRHLHTYRGLFRCAHCNYSLCGERQKGHVYYRCHTLACPLKGYREERIEEEVQAFFDRRQITDVANQKLTDAIRIWFAGRPDATQEIASIDLRISQARGRIEKLTDALIDQLIDKHSFTARKEAILLEVRKLEQFRTTSGKRGRDLRKLLEFFELVKTLARLYEIAEPPERRHMLELATSNRTASAESLALEPSFWLRAAIDLTTVPLGCLSKTTSRTGDEMLEQRLEGLLRPKDGPSVEDLVAQMTGIMARCNGTANRDKAA